MRPLVGLAEAGELDRRTQADCALDPLLLMENAAVRLWLALEPLLRERGDRGNCPLVALAGKGNNGGDALALLRQARFAGYTELGAILTDSRPGELAARHADSLRAMGIPVHVWGESASAELLSRAGLLLDGIAGTGIRGSLRGASLELARAAAASGHPVVAVDLPSGLAEGRTEEGFVLPATWTLSIEPRKASLYYPASRDLAGRIIPIEGVFPRDAEVTGEAILLEAGDLAGFLPRVPPSAHKGLRGRLGIVAGSPGMTGAALLAAHAAAAAGAGLIHLYVPGSLYGGLALGGGWLGGAIVRPEHELAGDLARLDAALAGPGWGREADRLPLLESLLEADLPLVLDADALRLLPAARRARTGAPLFLTPHPGEFDALFGIPASTSLVEPSACLARKALEMNAAIALKGGVTWIADPRGGLSVWDGSEPSLAVAGSGDVLAGLAAGLLAGASARGTAASARPLHAAVIAHGLAGKRARARRGWYEASALVEEAGKLLGARE